MLFLDLTKNGFNYFLRSSSYYYDLAEMELFFIVVVVIKRTTLELFTQ